MSARPKFQDSLHEIIRWAKLFVDLGLKQGVNHILHIGTGVSLRPSCPLTNDHGANLNSKDKTFLCYSRNHGSAMNACDLDGRETRKQHTHQSENYYISYAYHYQELETVMGKSCLLVLFFGRSWEN